MLFHKHAYLKIRHSSSLFPQNYPPHITTILKLCYTRLFFPCFSKKFIPLKPREAPAHRGRFAQNGGKVPHTAEGSRKTARRFRTPRKALAKRREGSAHRGRLPQNRSIEENSYSLLNIFELWQLKSRVQAQT